MNTEDSPAPHAPEPAWVSYIDGLKIVSASLRPRVSGIADAASVEGEQKIPDETGNWAAYIDRIYIEELMRRLGHRKPVHATSWTGARTGIKEQ